MAKKRKKERKEWIITKGRLSRWQRERRISRYIVIGASLVIAAIIGVIAYGYYDSEVKPFHQTVIRVNDKTFDMSYYIKMLRFYWISGGQNPSMLDLLSDQVINLIENDELIRQEASKLGLKATAEEIDNKIRQQFSPPEKEKSEGSAEKENSKQLFEKFLKRVQLTEEEYRELIATDILRKKLRDYIGREKVPEKVPQIKVEGILVDKKDLDTVKAKLKAGESLSSLAEKFSKYSGSKGNKADLGWIPKGIMGEDFDKVAFKLKPGVLSEPISVAGGERYWFIKVLKKEEARKLEQSQREILEAQAFSQWFAEEKKKNQIEDYFTEKLKSWAIDKVSKKASK